MPLRSMKFDRAQPDPTRAARRALAAAAALLISAWSAACADTGVVESAGDEAAGSAFAVYALSRGRGVPDAARAALAEAKSVLEGLRAEGAAVTISEERIGIEGETRLCARFADPDLAEQTLARVRDSLGDVDLVNVAREACGAEQKP